MNQQQQPVSLDSVAEAAALIQEASGADTAAIDALETVVANLRRAREAREQLTVRVPTEALRQALLQRAEDRR